MKDVLQELAICRAVKDHRGQSKEEDEEICINNSHDLQFVKEGGAVKQQSFGGKVESHDFYPSVDEHIQEVAKKRILPKDQRYSFAKQQFEEEKPARKQGKRNWQVKQ